MKKTLLLGVCAAILLATAAPAFAQYPPPPSPTCRVVNTTTGSHRAVSPGDSVLFGGRRWQASSSVIAGFHQKESDTTQVQNVPVDSNGDWSTTFVIPSSVENGPAVFGAIGRNENGRRFRCRVPVQVVGASSLTSSASEPAGITTGMASVGVLLVASALLMWRHRRRVKGLTA